MDRAATDQALQRAFECHEAGRLQEAEAAHRQVLAADAENAEAWSALICGQTMRAGTETCAYLRLP